MCAQDGNPRGVHDYTWPPQALSLGSGVPAESRESLPYRCSTCLLTGLLVMDSHRPEFIPNENMEKGPDGWVWKCPKHKDPSKEATAQALIKLGLWGAPPP